MNPVSASPILAMISPAPSQPIQGSPFQDILGESANGDVNAASDPAGSTAPITLGSGSANGSSASASMAGTMQWAASLALPQPQTSDGSAGAQDLMKVEPVNMPETDAAFATSEQPIWVKSVTLSPQMAGIISTDDKEPVLAEDQAATVDPAMSAPVSSPAAPSSAPMLAQVNVALALAGTPSAVKTPDNAADTEALGLGMELRTTKLNGLANGKSARAIQKEGQAKPSEILTASLIDAVSGQSAGLEGHNPVGAAAFSVTPPTLPMNMPVAELRQLVLAQDREWIGALSRDIVSNAARDNQLQFTLIPEHLGQLDVALTTDNGKVDIRLEASTAAAAQIISADQARLIEDLRQSGLKLGQFEMSNRQNNNGQQKAPTPERQTAENTSTSTLPKASSKAQGRFA